MAMKLNDEEQDILAGKAGPVPQQALQHQIKVGDFFGAATSCRSRRPTSWPTPKASARPACGGSRGSPPPRTAARVRIPTITDPRGTDFAKAQLLGQTAAMLDLERRAIAAFVKLGVAMTDTCINYQTIQAPTRNEHTAFGDTGVVIYSNSVCGARSNFEGGPSALVGRAYRAHAALWLSSAEMRRATLRIRVDYTPRRSMAGARLAASSAASRATTGRSR